MNDRWAQMPPMSSPSIMYSAIMQQMVPVCYDAAWLETMGGSFSVRVTGVGEYTLIAMNRRVVTLAGLPVDGITNEPALDLEIAPEVILSFCRGLLLDVAEDVLSEDEFEDREVTGAELLFNGMPSGGYVVRETTDYGSDLTAARAGSVSMVAIDSAAAATINSAGDRDWFAVALHAGVTYRIDLRGAQSGRGTLSDPYLYGIYNAMGSLALGGNDDSNGTLESQLVFTPNNSGVYYIAAGAYGSNTGTYLVSVVNKANTAPLLPMVEAGGDFGADLAAARNEQIGGVSVNSAAQGAINAAGDKDWYAVALQAGVTYRFDLRGAASGQLRREYSELVGDIASQTAEEQATLGALDEAKSKRENDIDSLNLKENETRSQLLDAERKLWLNSNIVAPYDGELIALKKGLGQAVTQGESVALINMAPQEPKSMLIVSPRAKRGKLTLSYEGSKETLDFSRQGDAFAASLQATLEKLVPGVAFKVLPSGSTDGVIIQTAQDQSDVLEQIEISDVDLFDSDGVPVFAMLFPVGDNWSAQEPTMVVLVRPEDAKRIKVGDYASIKPDFEKSLIGAQIQAHVSQVSPYVATTIESQALIGSAEVARSLAANQQGVPQGMAAVLRFDKDEAGQLIIHGKSLARTLTPGSTATAHITVDQASPIAVLLPFYVDVFK